MVALLFRSRVEMEYEGEEPKENGEGMSQGIVERERRCIGMTAET
jgi:hypothetical protein